MDIADKILDAHFPECPIRNVIARIGDRWSILILLTLEPAKQPMRFKEIEQAIPDISQKMLTQTLRRFRRDLLRRPPPVPFRTPTLELERRLCLLQDRRVLLTPLHSHRVRPVQEG